MEYNDFLDGKEAPMLSQIVSELNLVTYVNRAYQTMLQEYIRKFFTIESVDLIYETISATPNAGKLIGEFFTTQDDMFKNDEFIVSKLYSELEYVMTLDELFFDKIDKLIMQPSMKSVIEEVL